MKIKMTSLAAGPAGIMYPGREYNLPDEQARELIDGGYAEITSLQIVDTIDESIETATLESAVETTMKKPSPRRHRRPRKNAKS